MSKISNRASARPAGPSPKLRFDRPLEMMTLDRNRYGELAVASYPPPLAVEILSEGESCVMLACVDPEWLDLKPMRFGRDGWRVGDPFRYLRNRRVRAGSRAADADADGSPPAQGDRGCPTNDVRSASADRFRGAAAGAEQGSSSTRDGASR